MFAFGTMVCSSWESCYITEQCRAGACDGRGLLTNDVVYLLLIPTRRVLKRNILGITKDQWYQILTMSQGDFKTCILGIRVTFQ